MRWVAFHRGHHFPSAKGGFSGWEETIRARRATLKGGAKTFHLHRALRTLPHRQGGAGSMPMFHEVFSWIMGMIPAKGGYCTGIGTYNGTAFIT